LAACHDNLLKIQGLNDSIKKGRSLLIKDSTAFVLRLSHDIKIPTNEKRKVLLEQVLAISARKAPLFCTCADP
jgi:hypothetical protein